MSGAGRAHVRSRLSRGAAAVEMALVTPLLVGIVGFVIASSLALYTRYQMIELAHFAVTECTASLPLSPSSVTSCISARVRAPLTPFTPACQVAFAAPAVQQVVGITSQSGMPLLTVTQAVTCRYVFGLPLLRLLSNAPAAISVGASATAPFLPTVL